jgi:hypothetical protein
MALCAAWGSSQKPGSLERASRAVISDSRAGMSKTAEDVVDAVFELFEGGS